MANAFLIVGVGGCGRGVCNHLKYELEQEYGNLKNALTRLLVIDGPAESTYALPGEPPFEIDTSPRSPEFCQTRDDGNPATVIRNIARSHIGERERYVAPWLDQAEAGRLPTAHIRPTEGFGGHRAPGHVYFHLDVNYIHAALQQAYSDTRGMVPRGRSQAIVCLCGSQSGGTGAGMLWDVAHLLRQLLAPYHDPLFLLLPLANSYHMLFNTQERRDETDAKNFAGMLNLMRFMNADETCPSWYLYDTEFRDRNSALFDLPLVLDGDVTASRVNDIRPQQGVVPVIADFLLSCIKDNLATEQIGNDYINWTNLIGNAPRAEKYATFGVYSIRYAWKEALNSFSYKFAFEIYNDILRPLGESFNQGRTEADRILAGTTFTQALTDSTAAKLAPGEWRALRSQLRVGRTGDAPAPQLRPLPEAVKHGGGILGFFGTPDATVIEQAERISGNMKTQVDNWLQKQQSKIGKVFLEDVEARLLTIFTKIQDGKRVPKTLRDDPSSIVVVRDMLGYLKDKFVAFEKYLEGKFDEFFYPEGQGRPDLIARQQTVVEEKRRIMETDDGNVGENQEAYLREAAKLLELEVWAALFSGVQAATTALKESVLRLWRLVGDDADGWVNRLTDFSEQMEDRYELDVTRRKYLTQFRLRAYLPAPDGPAEEALFDAVAEPVLNSLLDRMHWEFAIDPKDPQRRYTILLRSPVAPGFDYERSAIALVDPQTGRPIESYQYDPYEHVHYARQQLAEPLSRRSIWDIMDLDFEHQWLPARKEDTGEARRPQFVDRYVQEWVDTLITHSAAQLHSTQSPRDEKAFVCAAFRSQGEETASIAAHFSAQIQQRLQRDTIVSDEHFSHEIRRCAIYLQVPVESWSYYSTAQDRYIRYNQLPERILIDIYPNEQNAFRLRQLIVQYLDPRFTGLLDLSVVALLDDFEVFQNFALAYVENLIPRRAGVSLAAPEIFYADLPAGRVDLGEVNDIDGLCLKVNQKALNEGELVVRIQDAIYRLWRNQEEEAAKSGTLAALLSEVEERAVSLTLPGGTRPRIARDHLRLAMQAVIKDYVSRVRTAQGIS